MGTPQDVSHTSWSDVDVDSNPKPHLQTTVIDTTKADIASNQDMRAAFLSTFSANDSRAIMAKVDRKFFWLLGIMFIIKQIDASNGANVKVLQVGESRNVLTELGMDADQYNWMQSIYGISYIIFEAPSSLLMKKMSPHVWQARIFMTWGIITACHAAVQNRHGLYTVRFLLGLFEAGFFPGVLAQMQAWYRTDEIGRPIAWFFGIQTFANIYGSLICYGVSYMNGIGGLSAWRWVYLLEGIATMVFALVIWVLLPDYPKSTRSNKWLTSREQAFLEARLPENAPKTSDSNFSWQEIIESLKSPLMWSFMVSQTMINIGGYALTWWLPTIVTDLGFVGLPKNQLLNIPPAIAAALGLAFSAWFVGKAYIVRPFYVAFLTAGMMICFIIFFTITNKVGIYIACILGTLFYQSFFVPFWSWRSATLSGTTGTAFTLGLQSGIGQLSKVVSPQLFRSQWRYNGYKNSFAISMATVIAGFFANLVTWYLTKNTEYDVMRVRRLILKARKKGKALSDEDIRIINERKFYRGFRKQKNQDAEV